MKKSYKFSLIIIIVFIFILTSIIFINEYNFIDIKNVKSSIIKITEVDKKEKILPGKVDMPGALKYIDDNILNKNDKIILLKNNIILATNKNRKDNGNLKALKENQKLNLSAEKKLDDMFEGQYFDHISPSGVAISDLSKKVSYDYILIGENLAMGNFKDEASLLDAWMDSPGHRANILNKKYTDLGIAVRKGNFKGQDVWIAVQHFGTSMSACPSIDQVLYTKITINEDQIIKMQNDFNTRRDMINKNVVYEGNTRNEQIDKYNALIDVYNKLLEEIKIDINNYNNQIINFNNCLLLLTS